LQSKGLSARHARTWDSAVSTTGRAGVTGTGWPTVIVQTAFGDRWPSGHPDFVRVAWEPAAPVHCPPWWPRAPTACYRTPGGADDAWQDGSNESTDGKGGKRRSKILEAVETRIIAVSFTRVIASAHRRPGLVTRPTATSMPLARVTGRR